MILYVFVVSYEYLPKIRHHLTLMGVGMIALRQSRLPSAVCRMVVTMTALAAIPLQAPIWALDPGAAGWMPFFQRTIENYDVVAIVMSLIIAVVVFYT